jgi:D-alanine-D-alanine ligase
LRIGILRSADETLAHGEAQDALAVQAVGTEARAIENACEANGWTPVALEAGRDPARTLAALREARCDVVFQLAESIAGDARLEAAAAWLLEWAGIPYTGSGPIAITLALQKPLARAVLVSRGVPVPDGFVLERADGDLPPVFARGKDRRWIVKPSREDASHGISEKSVVAGERGLRERAAHVIATYRQPALVEEFVDGREINVSILGNGADAELLPIAEIDWTGFPDGLPRIVTFSAKWDTKSAEYKGSTPVPPRDLTEELEGDIRRRARAAYDALDLAGYGRVDMRVHPDRGPLVIDVNPNPDISPDAGLAKAAARGGITYEELLARIVRAAQARVGAPAVARD